MNRWTCSPSWLRLAPPHRGPWFALLWFAVGTAGLMGQAEALEQPAAPEPPILVRQIYALRNRAAGDAVAMVENLLSSRGALELQPGENTLVIRDTAPVVRRIVARLRDYDQPPRWVRLDVQIVRAGEAAGAGAQTPGPELPPELVRRLRELLRFDSFSLMAQAGLEMMEGERVVYQFGGDYRVEFELGVLSASRQLRLQDFIVGKGPADDSRPLIHTNLNLTIERPMVLGLARTEASERALMVVLTTHLLEEIP